MAWIGWVNWAAGLLGTALIGWSAYQIGCAAWRARRARVPPVRVQARATAHLIGLGITVLAAVVGGGLTAGLSWPASIHPLVAVLCQLAAGMALAGVAAWVYDRWVSEPVRAWFAREEGSEEHG